MKTKKHKRKQAKLNEAEDFARRIALTMLELKSSHCYFILQQAYQDRDEMGWEEFEEMLEAIAYLDQPQ